MNYYWSCLQILQALEFTETSLFENCVPGTNSLPFEENCFGPMILNSIRNAPSFSFPIITTGKTVAISHPDQYSACPCPLVFPSPLCLPYERFSLQAKGSFHKGSLRASSACCRPFGSFPPVSGQMAALPDSRLSFLPPAPLLRLLTSHTALCHRAVSCPAPPACNTLFSLIA